MKDFYNVLINIKIWKMYNLYTIATLHLINIR